MRRYMGAMVVVGASALLAAAEDRSADEQKAIDAVMNWGGKITVDETAPGKPVVGVDLHGASVTAVGLKKLAALEALRTLDLSDADMTDAKFKGLAALVGLQTLNLSDTAVSDDGLSALAALNSGFS